MLGVHHFRMEQQAVQAALDRLHRDDGGRGTRRRDREAAWHAAHIVAVARPDAELVGNPFEQPRGDRPCHADGRVAELALARPPHVAAEQARHQLHAVADAEDGDAQVEDARVAGRCAGIGNTPRSTREDETGGALGLDGRARRIERHDLGVDRHFTQTTCDELRVLRAEIEDENRLM